jgi:hypothetical protein
MFQLYIIKGTSFLFYSSVAQQPKLGLGYPTVEILENTLDNETLIIIIIIIITSLLVFGQNFWLLIMRSRIRFPVLPWGFFLEGEDSHDVYGLGSLVELGFKTPPCTSYSYINIHLI